ncbi:MAG: bifunctional phosphopantothenoylcysteine decarboxylase/phosphopantothenate--cysteine ligase CoaBC [Zoogloeaceae bacterium]|jgi:phosphopantothenoylcysteine decarboxylase/phosphopantothenate--cysteine ligase|nr:bifunctional phosphopantothenoylcysteine decarboxylase/phosphopantothenate--cysteine ligase CoaBC [Zoogloeaceae bacterium]
MLQGKRIVLGVTGGVAAYKAAVLTRLLLAAGAEVQVALSEAAAGFVSPMTFQALSGKPIMTRLEDARVDNGMPHITLSRAADALLIAPATAHFLARAAQGLADDLLTALALARACPLLVAPAMNRQMWEHPATRRNVAQLRADGVTVLGPCSGLQACGEEGEGRMLEPEMLVKALVAFFAPKVLAGEKLLLTAGPTFEAIDPVRGLTNLSSGRMGFALAEAAANAGASVTLIAGPVAQPTPFGVERIDVVSAREMRVAVLERVAEADVFVSVAAVADYRPAQAAGRKIKKDAEGLPMLELLPNPDILAEVAALPQPPFCVGFAAESENLETYAQAKRRRKKLPLIVGNLIQDGFGGVSNRVILFDDAGAHPLPFADKATLARQIVDNIAQRLARNQGKEPA